MHKIIARILSAVACGIFAISPAFASQSATILANGQPLDAQEGWLIDGTSYVTLAALTRIDDGYTLRWEGGEAIFEGETFTLSARPSAHYIELNDRAIYVAGGVPVVDGRTALPTRILADALEGTATWDGETKTVALTLGTPAPDAVSYPADDLYWLSRIISAESRGEQLLGQIAVGNVVINRAAHARYPATIEGVIFDKNFGVQFEPVSNGTVYDSPTAQSVIAAKLALEGADIVGNALYFFAPALSQGTWIRNNCAYLQTIGCHEFYID